MSGACTGTEAQGRDFSDQCSGLLANVEYSDGRISFVFQTTTTPVMTMSFSGQGRSQVHEGPDVVVQPVDSTFVGVAAAGPDHVAVAGTCRFTNPYAGPGIVSCSADGNLGHFAAEFRSDGRPPSSKSLR